MSKIEDILRLEQQLSSQIEEAEEKSRKIIESSRKQAQDILKEVSLEVASYKARKEEELKEQIRHLRLNLEEKFELRKKIISQSLEKKRKEFLDWIIRKISGQDWWFLIMLEPVESWGP